MSPVSPDRKEMVEFLLSRGADVNRRDKNQAYALSFASSGGDPEIVQMILDAGADLNFIDPSGRSTLLHFATSRGLGDFVDYLVARGTDVNIATNEGQTALHWVVRREDPEMVAKLLAAGANPSPVDSSGMTPIIGACFSERTEAVQLLLAHGADPNEESDWGGTALGGAVRHGNADLARLLVDRGAEVNHQLDNQSWLIHAAAEAGDAAVMRILLEGGARTDAIDERWGTTALHAAALKGYADVAEALVDAGASPNGKNHQGRTPVQLAASCGHRDVVELLSASGTSSREIEVMRECPADFRDLGDREAIVWYLGHSGWAVKTENHFLVFDYHNRDREPAAPGLCNGFINPGELAGEKVTVFVSHEHGDRYDPAIFEWRENLDDVAYVLGCQPEDVPPYRFIGGREVREIRGMTVTTIESNDTGVGFLIEADGMVIYHAGDHANRYRDFSGPYKAEIEWLAEKGVRPDLAFMPISGCGFGDQEAVKAGVHYTIETLEPFVFLPMHGGSDAYRYKEFVDECEDRFPGTKMEAVEYRGDHFRYRKGKIS